MKAKFLLLLFFVVFEKSRAQTYVAGDISYVQDSINSMKYTVTVNLYAQSSGNIGSDSLFINWGDSYTHRIPLINSTLVSPDFYHHVFIDTHTFTAPPDSNFYTVSVMSPIRVFNISNMNSSIFISFYIEAKINAEQHSLFTGNHSPSLNNAPTFNAYLNQPYQENLNPADIDGDSIAIEMITPMEGRNSDILNYLLPDQYCNVLGVSNTFTVGQQTGVIDWDNPCRVGVFNIAVRISEFRNGILIGSVMRDQNIYVTSTTAIPSTSDVFAFSLSPNPATNTILLSNIAPHTSVTITNLLGEVMLKDIAESERKEIDISRLPNGMYFINNRKFVKE